MGIYTAILQFSDVADGMNHTCDVIEHEGRFWLVSDWLEYPAQGVMRPIRIVCFENHRHQKTIGQNRGDFILNDPFPKAVLDGRTTGTYEVIENPGIAVPIPRTRH